MIIRKKIEVTAYLDAYKEYFPESETKIARDQEGKKFIEASIPSVNLGQNMSGEWKELPVHFYSDLPIRLEDMWQSMQKRKLETFIDYLKSIGDKFNQTVVLTKMSRAGNRYFVVTTRAKFAHYKNKHYRGYSVETI